MIRFVLGAIFVVAAFGADGLSLPGSNGPGRGKHVVLIAGDEEYRSEEALPQLARILSTRHGFRTTVLFAIDKNDGSINPNQIDNIPGLEALDKADLMIVFLRWRNLPDEQMKHIVDYVESGRPVIGLRTATHCFNLKSPTYQRYTWNNKDSQWEGGFGRQVLGETWIAHHGRHGVQSTRGVFAPDAAQHPILRGVRDGEIWGSTDVYRVRLPLPGDSRPLILGQVLQGMKPSDPPAEGAQNFPMMPVAWVKTYKGARVFNTTMGAATDLENEALRRLVVNAVFWTLHMEDKIPARTNVDLVGEYKPLPFKFNGHQPGLKVSDLAK